MITTQHGIEGDLGVGVFMASPAGTISPVVVPGDPAPGGGRFDYADEPSLNGRNDIAFVGHVAGTPCELALPQDIAIGCARDLFLRDGTTGQVQRLVALGDAAPGGGTFRNTRSAVINTTGEVLFMATVETDAVLRRGLFLARDGTVEPVARFGQEAPGGGRFTVLPSQPGNWDLNDRGDVSFSSSLDVDDNEDGLQDQGLFRWSEGVLTVVARSGMAVPGGGEIVVLQPVEFVGSPAPFSGALINNRRATLFAAFVRFGQFQETVLYRASGDDLTAVQRASSIGDFVWADTDGDGVQDAAEPGIRDVFILLRDSGGIVVGATFSDAEGRYVFGDLPAGDYSLQFFSPSGYRPTGMDLGPDDVDSDADPVTGRTETVTIVPGRPEESVDAGYVLVPRASIGGVVWLDSNGDGLRDRAAEPGVGGVEVALLDDRGQVLATQLTHQQFGYIFPRLAAGDYRVRFTAPPGFAFTIKDAGGDDQRDSDADPATGLTHVITLGSSQIDLSVHAGLVPSP